MGSTCPAARDLARSSFHLAMGLELQLSMVHCQGRFSASGSLSPAVVPMAGGGQGLGGGVAEGGNGGSRPCGLTSFSRVEKMRF